MKLAHAVVFIAVLVSSQFVRADALDQWLTRTSPVPVSLEDVVYGQGIFVGVGTDTNTGVPRLIVSSNGMDWNRFASFAHFTPRAITFGSNGLFVAVGRADLNDSANEPGVIVSTNGTNWAYIPTFGDALVNTNFEAVTYGDGLFVALGRGVAATSYDGTNWATHALPSSRFFLGVAYGNGVWVAVAPGNAPGGAIPTYGALMTSSDGTNWVLRDNFFNGYRVTFGNGRFIATHGPFTDASPTPHESIRVSSDGVNWAELTNAPAIFGGRVVYGGGMYLAVGRNPGGTNIVAVSFDATNWVARMIGGTNVLRSVAFGTNTFVAVGDVMLQSQDIRPRFGVVPSDGTDINRYNFTFTGLSNALYRLEVSTNFTDWQLLPRFRATGGEQVLSGESENWPARFIRALHVPE